jgi:hypothetical protein
MLDYVRLVPAGIADTTEVGASVAEGGWPVKKFLRVCRKLMRCMEMIIDKWVTL